MYYNFQRCESLNVVVLLQVEADKAKLSIRLREAQVQIMELLRNEKLLRDQINSLYSQRDIRPSAGFRQGIICIVATVYI